MPGTFTLVTGPADLDSVINAVSGSPVVAVDLETTGLRPQVDRARLLSLTVYDCDGGLSTYVVDLFAVDASPLWPTLAEATIVGHNLTFDLGFLARLGFVPGAVQDTMILSQLVYGTRQPKGFHGLGAVVERELGTAVDKRLQKSDWSGTLSSKQLEYAAADTARLLPLHAKLTEKITDAGLQHVADIETRCLPALAWLSQAGVGFDVTAWGHLAEEARQEAEGIARQLDTAAPNREGYFSKDGAWNWNSPDQVKEAFKLVGVNLASTDDDALAQVEHPLAALLRRHRSISKMASTYGPDWYKDALHAGRIHAGWRQLGADSGRMACSSPNLQNLPGDVRYRHCFRAPDGRTLVKADYSQIELRIAAKIANDKAMLDAYGRGADLHTLTAQRVLGVAEVTKQDRKLAKALNFGLLYGMGSNGFQKYAQSNYGVEMTLADAERYRSAFFDAYPDLRRWHKKVRDAHATETRTRAGRRRLIGPDEYDTLRLNSPVQGTGADGLKQALALLWERRDQCPGAFPVLVVHDEIVVEADVGQADAAALWLKAAMLDGMAPLIAPVPVAVDVTIAQTWGGE